MYSWVASLIVIVILVILNLSTVLQKLPGLQMNPVSLTLQVVQQPVQLVQLPKIQNLDLIEFKSFKLNPTGSLQLQKGNHSSSSLAGLSNLRFPESMEIQPKPKQTKINTKYNNRNQHIPNKYQSQENPQNYPKLIKPVKSFF